MDIWKKAEKDIILHGNKLNIAENCLERHALANPKKLALVIENESDKITKYTYKELNEQASKFANLLKKLNIKQNSRVFMFLPKVPEMYISVLGTIKYGSVAAPLFEAFQRDGLMLRLQRGDANVLVTNKELAARLPKNIKKLIPSLKNILIIDSPNYKKQIKNSSSEFNAVLKNKFDTALMIFTSSTAGTPVAGIQIPHYAIVQQHATAKLVLDLKEKDNYWCTAHPGWVTGSVYGILAPFSIGCTNFVLESHFEVKRWTNFIKKNKISVIYTAPTALGLLKSEIKKSDLAGVRNVCSVGEALTSTLFNIYKKFGVTINDTYWQTETGAMVICNWPGLRKKSGALGKPIPGIKAKIIDGTIALKPKWPSIMTGIYKHKKMYQSYFKSGWFRTNDLARVDREGYFFFEGRKDDMIKTSGERVSPIEIESILMKHPSVKEAAVIGIPDKTRGQIIKAFIILNKGYLASDQLKQEISFSVKSNYAGHAYPKEIEFVNSLPKTNSGKIIRAKLREN